MRARAFIWIGIAYAVALVAALGAGALLVQSHPEAHPITVIATADITATVVVFGFSFAFSNSSFYDPYWSVAPLLIVLYWTLSAAPVDTGSLRSVLVLLALGVWGARLTYNWARGWHGLRHEDWRYEDKRREFPNTYWGVSFGGLHMVPTLLVLLGCLPCFVVVSASTHPMGWIDGLAFVVTAAAIWIEWSADAQLHRFRSESHPDGTTLTSGLWRLSRHPNYFGEILFWWGLFLFGLAANPGWWWTGVGALGITVLFVTISLPLMERRAMDRRLDYEVVVSSTPLLIPWPRRSPTQAEGPSNP
jgi:steroid 5-alpha reductase family enzyme